MPLQGAVLWKAACSPSFDSAWDKQFGKFDLRSAVLEKTSSASHFLKSCVCFSGDFFLRILTWDSSPSLLNQPFGRNRSIFCPPNQQIEVFLPSQCDSKMTHVTQLSGSSKSRVFNRSRYPDLNLLISGTNKTSKISRKHCQVS